MSEAYEPFHGKILLVDFTKDYTEEDAQRSREHWRAFWEKRRKEQEEAILLAMNLLPIENSH